jgi:hypothetical protein
MATQHRPTGRKPGPVPKGARKQFTIRFPDPQYATLAAGQDAAGYRYLGDYVVALIAAAEKARVTVLPLKQPLPLKKGPRTQCTIRFPDPQYATLTAGQEAAGYENFGDYVVAFIAAAQQALVTVRPVNQPLPLSA